MRLGRIVGSVAVMALALAAWRAADRAAAEPCPPADSTAQGVAEIVGRLAALGLLALAAAVPFLRTTGPQERFPDEDARAGDPPEVLFD